MNATPSHWVDEYSHLPRCRELPHRDEGSRPGEAPDCPRPERRSGKWAIRAAIRDFAG